MFNKFFFKLIILSCLLSSTLSAGNLKKPGNFFTIQTNGAIVTLNLVVPNHTYSNVGIEILNSENAIFSSRFNWLSDNGKQGLFTINQSTPFSFSVSGPSSQLSFVLSLNGPGKVTSQIYTVPVSTNLLTVGAAQVFTSGVETQSNSLVYRSIDGGNSWSPSLLTDYSSSSATFSQLKSVYCSRSGVNCFTGGYNTNTATLFNTPIIYYTNDSGNSWNLANLPSTSDSLWLFGSSASSSGKFGVVVGENLSNGNAFASTSSDFGINWESPRTITSSGGALNSVACDQSAQNCVAVGYNGSWVLVSNDFAQTWTSAVINIPTGLTMRAIYGVGCSESLSRCVVAGYGEVNGKNNALSYYSSNSGNTWVGPNIFAIPDGFDESVLDSVSCNSSGLVCFAVGYKQDSSGNNSSLSYYTMNGGVSWSVSEFDNSASNHLTGVWCPLSGYSCIGVDSLTYGSNLLTSISYISSATSPGNWPSNYVSLPIPSNYNQTGVIGVNGSG